MDKFSPKKQRRKGIIWLVISIPLILIVPILGLLFLAAGLTIYFRNRGK